MKIAPLAAVLVVTTSCSFILSRSPPSPPRKQPVMCEDIYGPPIIDASLTAAGIALAAKVSVGPHGAYAELDRQIAGVLRAAQGPHVVIRSVVVVLLALCGAAYADHDHRPKKDRLRALKSPKHPAPLRAGTKPAKLINIYNSWTHELLAVDAPRKPRAETVNRFLRDHFTNEPTNMEPMLLSMVVAAALKFKSDTAIVVSAFRHPKYNLMLRKKGRQVARDSQHAHGTAVDFYIPRVATMTLHAWAKEQAAGGVGLYLESGFVHIDTGAVRYWSGD